MEIKTRLEMHITTSGPQEIISPTTKTPRSWLTRQVTMEKQES